MADLGVGDRGADLLHVEKLLHIDHGGHVERQVVRGLASEQDLAAAVLLHEHGLRSDHGGRHARGRREHDQANHHAQGGDHLRQAVR